MPIDRTAFNALVDSNGTPGHGSVWDKAAFVSVLLDPIDAAIAAAGGITFGNWTPTVASTGGGTPTYGAQLGRYSKNGREVTAWGDVTLATLGTLAAGNLRIASLPFTSHSVLSMPGTVGYFAGMTTSVITFYIHAASGSTNADLYFRASAGAAATILQVSDISGTFRLMFTITYEASS